MTTIHLGAQEELFNNIQSGSIDAIITDPPYGLSWNHKIETSFNFKQFVENSFRVLKEGGFLVYFGQEPTMSTWNATAQEKFKYLAEIIWYKRGNSSPFQYPLRVHEKIIIFTKGKGKLNKAEVDWEWEKEELLEYSTKASLIRALAEVKQLVNKSASLEVIKQAANDNKYTKTKEKSKVNDGMYTTFRYKTNKYAYLFNKKKLTTLWGCRPHNQQGYNKEEYNIKHPTVKPVQIIERLLEMVTQANSIVLDPFMGSGTTGVACNNMKRQFVGFELDKDYFSIAKNRLEEKEVA